jgi:hypothetical protein
LVFIRRPIQLIGERDRNRTRIFGLEGQNAIHYTTRSIKNEETINLVFEKKIHKKKGQADPKANLS